MNFVTADLEGVLKGSKNPSTQSKTLHDVAYFQRFLSEIKGITDKKIEDFPEEELIARDPRNSHVT